MPTVKTDPVLEAIACKLFGIERVPKAEQAKMIKRAAKAAKEAAEARYKQWVDDLQGGMYINCVYCGHRYGPNDEVPASMADVLKEHVENCPEHPMSKLKAERDELLAERNKMLAELRRRDPEEQKKRINEILAGVLSGSEGKYRTDEGFVRWGIVEQDLYKVVDGE